MGNMPQEEMKTQKEIKILNTIVDLIIDEAFLLPGTDQVSKLQSTMMLIDRKIMDRMKHVREAEIRNVS